MATAVNDRSAAVEAMACEHPMLEALMAGTRAMRALGETLLPKFPLEDEADHKTRLSTATLFPAYRRTVSVMASKPFSKPLTFSDETPAEIAGKPAKDGSPKVVGWADDIDREGVNLHTFAAEMFTESFYGLAGILVEAPKPIEPTGAVVTRADEMANGVRPYFVRVMHGQILGWRVKTVNGARRLAQLRLSECATEADGEFGEKVVERVRVLEPGSWRLYQKTDTPGPDGKAQWVQLDGQDGAGSTGLDYIPFVPIYGARQGYMQGACPLLDLAYLNVKHWQTQSDQDDSTKFARKRMLVVTGADPEKKIVASASYAVSLPQGADVKVVQGSAESVEVGRSEIAALEDQMIQAGAELLVKKPGARTATESANDAEANKSDLQRMAEGFESALDTALKYMADYAKLRTGGKVTLFKDYGAATLSDASAQLILAMEVGGLITKETAIREYQRRGTLSPDLDPTAEVQAVQDQPPALGATPPLSVTPIDQAA